MRTCINYIFFAMIATIVNIASQEITTMLYGGDFFLVVSMIIGTVCGLLVKYILDKKYIFKYVTNDQVKNTKTFVLYSVMGLLTTTIFWGAELTFDMIFQTKEMRYVGAVLGLSIGYITKYQLDKKYVFTDK